MPAERQRTFGEELIAALTEFADALEAGDLSKFRVTRQVRDDDQTDLGASDDRPLGPDHPIYRQG